MEVHAIKSSAAGWIKRCFKETYDVKLCIFSPKINKFVNVEGKSVARVKIEYPTGAVEFHDCRLGRPSLKTRLGM
jgi:hypothetical protein